MIEETEPLKSGDPIPEHPASTTAHRITKILEVKDAEDGNPLTAGIHRSTLQMLMDGVGPLKHLYHFGITYRNGHDRIYHTRNAVVLRVETDVNTTD